MSGTDYSFAGFLIRSAFEPYTRFADVMWDGIRIAHFPTRQEAEACLAYINLLRS